MAATIKLVGRTTDFSGKTLWEIVGNLKDFGVGRIIVRNMFQRYKEPCYMKIMEVRALPNTKDSERKCIVKVEKVFRGRKYPKLTEISSTSYKADYRLIPKNEEYNYVSEHLIDTPKTILSNAMELPPLLKEFIVKETGNPNPLMQVRIQGLKNKFFQLSNDLGNNEILPIGYPKSIKQL